MKITPIKLANYNIITKVIKPTWRMMTDLLRHKGELIGAAPWHGALFDYFNFRIVFNFCAKKVKN